MAFEVDVQYAVDETTCPSPERIASWVRVVLEPRLRAAQLVVRIVDAEEGRELNERYRRGNGPTNVLSFPFEHPERLDPPLLGDLVVCAPVVEREADEQCKPAEAHWAHMVVHGVLHLVGHDHETDEEAGVMERLEREILESLGIDDPYALRTAQG